MSDIIIIMFTIPGDNIVLWVLRNDSSFLLLVGGASSEFDRVNDFKKALLPFN